MKKEKEESSSDTTVIVLSDDIADEEIAIHEENLKEFNCFKLYCSFYCGCLYQF